MPTKTIIWTTIKFATMLALVFFAILRMASPTSFSSHEMREVDVATAHHILTETSERDEGKIVAEYK